MTSPVSHRLRSTVGERAIPASSGALFRDLGIAILIFLGTVASLFPFFRFITLNADEGIVLQGAQRILDGQVLYRDFFSFYTPGSYYWTALLLRLFGNSILVPRFSLLVYGGFLSAWVYLLARRICGLWVSVLAAFLTTLIALPFSFYVQHNWESTILVTMAVPCMLATVDRPTRGKWFSLGALVGLTMLFEQSKGSGLFVGAALGFGLLAWRGGLRISKSFLTSLIFGITLPFVVTFLYFASNHALFSMLADWFWPLRHYSMVNRVPYGYFPLASGQVDMLRSMPIFWKAFVAFSLSPLVLIPALPVLGLAVLVFHARKLRSVTAASKTVHYVMVSSTLVGLWLGVLVSRRDAGHFIYLLPLFILPLAWILESVALPSSLLPKIRPLIVMWIALSFLFLGLSMLFEPLKAHTNLQTRRGTLKITGTDTVLPYVQSHVKPGDSIFVYPYQPLYYYLAATSNATSYEFFQPGMTSGEQVADALRQLDQKKPATVLFTTSFGEMIAIAWPGTPDSIIAQPDPVALYIVRHYRPCTTLHSTTNGDWLWLYMVRMDAECPHDPASQPTISR